MTEISLFIYTRNTDLHAMSAYETLTEVLKYPHLHSLKRYRHIRLELNVPTLADATEWVKTFNQTSFKLLNPNKEAYFISHLPIPPHTDQETVLIGEVTSADLDAEGEELYRLISPGNEDVVMSVKPYIVWELVLDSHGYLDKDLQDEVYVKVVNATGYEYGLLTNPIYETFSFLDRSHIYKQDVGLVV